jgi:hypothetical protein
MDLPDIAAWLAACDGEPAPPRLRARLLVPRTTGGSKPWDCQVEDGSWYVVKSMANPQDRRTGKPVKFLATDLICGRLGQLFRPALTPQAAVVEIPPAVAEAAVHPRTRRRPAERPSPGPGFGSQLVEGAVEIKADRGERIASVPPAEVARLVTFQTWLRGVDVSALVTADRRLLSIDHGFYLTAHRWDRADFETVQVTVKLPSQLRDREALSEPAVFAPALAELSAIADESIIRAFAALPTEWEVSLSLRARAAHFVLRRRPLVAQALSALWRRGR